MEASLNRLQHRLVAQHKIHFFLKVCHRYQKIYTKTIKNHCNQAESIPSFQVNRTDHYHQPPNGSALGSSLAVSSTFGSSVLGSSSGGMA